MRLLIKRISNSINMIEDMQNGGGATYCIYLISKMYLD